MGVSPSAFTTNGTPPRAGWIRANATPDYSKRGLPKRLVPLTPQQLHNAYRHSLDESIPFKCDLIERLVPIILQDSPDFFN